MAGSTRLQQPPSESPGRISRAAKVALRTSLVYALVAGLWILLSDRLAGALFSDAETLTRVATMKGFAFVACTALLLYGALRAQLVRWEQEVRTRQATEASLRASERALAHAQQLVQVGGWTMDVADNEFQVSVESARFIGCPPGRVSLDAVRHVIHPEDKARVKEHWLAALAGAPMEVEHRVVVDGKMRWLFVKAEPERDAGGAVIRLVGVTQDITERREAEAHLRAREQLFRGVFNQQFQFMAILDPVGRVREVNELPLRVGGFRREDFVGVLYWETPGWGGRGDWAKLWLARLAQAAGSESPILAEDVVRSPDGDVGHVDSATQAVHNPDGSVAYFIVQTTDSTVRRQAEQTLRASEERFRQVVETIHEVFWISDAAQSRLIYLSPRFEGIWGRPRGALDRAHEVWWGALHADDRSRVLASGHIRVFADDYDETYRIMRPTGEVRWIRDRAFPVRDATGAIQRIVGVAEDITERKHLQQQSLRTQRLEAIGTLASGISHDMNNILAPMLMVPRLLRPALANPSERALLDVMEQGAQRGAEIVRQLLTFSRGLEGQRGPVQVRHLLKEMTAMMRETFPREIEVVSTLGAGIWTVVADATQLHQVLMNLCLNARDAMPHGGKLRLTAENVQLGADALRLHPAAQPGPYVILTVADTGVGIAPEIMERIFDPFFTTKEIGKGTGLGLSTVLGIVKGHAGFLTVESVPGHGSTFRVYLPASDEQALTGVPETAIPLPRGHGEIILLVDDEAALRLSLQVVLQKHGYEVLVAADGHEALQVLAKDSPRVQLVLTDLMMPGMNGLALIRALRERQRPIQIIATTGLDHERNADELAKLGVTDVLHKPFSPADVLSLIQQRLSAGG